MNTLSVLESIGQNLIGSQLTIVQQTKNGIFNIVVGVVTSYNVIETGCKLFYTAVFMDNPEGKVLLDKTVRSALEVTVKKLDDMYYVLDVDVHNNIRLAINYEESQLKR